MYHYLPIYCAYGRMFEITIELVTYYLLVYDVLFIGLMFIAFLALQITNREVYRLPEIYGQIIEILYFIIYYIFYYEV